MALKAQPTSGLSLDRAPVAIFQTLPAESDRGAIQGAVEYLCNGDPQVGRLLCRNGASFQRTSVGKLSG